MPSTPIYCLEVIANRIPRGAYHDCSIKKTPNRTAIITGPGVTEMEAQARTDDTEHVGGSIANVIQPCLKLRRSQDGGSGVHFPPDKVACRTGWFTLGCDRDTGRVLRTAGAKDHSGEAAPTPNP